MLGEKRDGIGGDGVVGGDDGSFVVSVTAW